MACEHGEPNPNACATCLHAEVEVLRAEILDSHDALHAQCSDERPGNLPDEIRSLRAQLAESQQAREHLHTLMVSAVDERNALRKELAESRAAVEVLRKALDGAKLVGVAPIGPLYGAGWEGCREHLTKTLASLPASSRAYAERVAALEGVVAAAKEHHAKCAYRARPYLRGGCALCDALVALAALPPEKK